MGPWRVVFYRDQDGQEPARSFLLRCPVTVRSTLVAVLEMVRDAPPPAFSGGGKWEAMHGVMRGYYEARVTGPGRRHYRLFCLLENGSAEHLGNCGFDGPRIVIVNGLDKPNATLFRGGTYRKHVRALGDDYASRLPRPVGD